MTADRAAAWDGERDPKALLLVAEAELGERDYRRVAAGWCGLVWPGLGEAYRRAVERIERAAARGWAAKLARLQAGLGYGGTWAERAVREGLFAPWRAGEYRPAGEYYRYALGEVGRAVGLARAVERIGPAPPDVHADHPWHAGFNAVCTEARVAQADIIRCVVGNPFRPVAFDPDWRTASVVALARTMYDGRDFVHMPILADALDDAGCTDAAVVGHCRGPGPHARGCWVVDAVLGLS